MEIGAIYQPTDDSPFAQDYLYMCIDRSYKNDPRPREWFVVTFLCLRTLKLITTKACPVDYQKIT